MFLFFATTAKPDESAFGLALKTHDSVAPCAPADTPWVTPAIGAQGPSAATAMLDTRPADVGTTQAAPRNNIHLITTTAGPCAPFIISRPVIDGCWALAVDNAA